jgi:hypothetical protein
MHQDAQLGAVDVAETRFPKEECQGFKFQAISFESTWLQVSRPRRAGVPHIEPRRRLEEAGILVPAVLRRAGLPQNLFEQTRILVSTEELFALWRAIGEVSKDASIGVRLGTETSIARFHPMGLAALSTESFGAAIDHMARYKRLSAPEEILQETVENEWAIKFRWSLAVDVEPAVLVEYCFAWLLTIAREGTGTRIKPLRVELVQPRSHTKSLEKHFGCPVVCGASRNAIIFRAGDAAIPFVTRNAELLGMLAPQFDLELKERTAVEDHFIEFSRDSRDIVPLWTTLQKTCT